eukprot:722581-Rhodomonas_salina.2
MAKMTLGWSCGCESGESGGRFSWRGARGARGPRCWPPHPTPHTLSFVSSPRHTTPAVVSHRPPSCTLHPPMPPAINTYSSLTVYHPSAANIFHHPHPQHQPPICIIQARCILTVSLICEQCVTKGGEGRCAGAGVTCR